ncbi:MAG TPA: sulfite oxidase-like oxidoreductase [Acidimicrobiia bacterium]|nr:sulfite oxidase-like oxidoreductase [Acidimicrobiia bacterium]
MSVAQRPGGVAAKSGNSLASVMGFFERNRNSLIEKGYSPDRLPPGQYYTERYPVLHVGDVPTVELSTWTLRVWGKVAREVTLTWEQLHALATTDTTVDIHCVTKWSKFDTHWEGVRVRDVLALAEPLPDATHVLQHAEYGYTTNTPLDAVLADDALLAWSYDGKPLEPVHGGPLRMVIPSLYFWKSAKWLRGLELLDHDEPGYWERNGYHNVGDPWREERYWGD